MSVEQNRVTESQAERVAGTVAMVLMRVFFTGLALMIGRIISGTDLPADTLGVPALVVIAIASIILTLLSNRLLDARRTLIAAAITALLVAAVWSGHAASRLVGGGDASFYERLGQRGPMDAILILAVVLVPTALVMAIDRRR